MKGARFDLPLYRATIGYTQTKVLEVRSWHPRPKLISQKLALQRLRGPPATGKDWLRPAWVSLLRQGLSASGLLPEHAPELAPHQSFGTRGLNSIMRAGRRPKEDGFSRNFLAQAHDWLRCFSDFTCWFQFSSCLQVNYQGWTGLQNKNTGRSTGSFSGRRVVRTARSSVPPSLGFPCLERGPPVWHVEWVRVKMGDLEMLVALVSRTSGFPSLEN